MAKPDQDLVSLFGEHVADLLAADRFDTVEKVQEASFYDLEAINGIGVAKAKKIQAAFLEPDEADVQDEIEAEEEAKEEEAKADLSVEELRDLQDEQNAEREKARKAMEKDAGVRLPEGSRPPLDVSVLDLPSEYREARAENVLLPGIELVRMIRTSAFDLIDPRKSAGQRSAYRETLALGLEELENRLREENGKLGKRFQDFVETNKLDCIDFPLFREFAKSLK